MPCEGCERLKQERSEAKAAFDAARERLLASPGVSSKEQQRGLLQSVLTAHYRLKLAANALDRHMQQEHEQQHKKAGPSDAGNVKEKNHDSDSGQPAP